MVEEAAPLVVEQRERTSVPVGALHERAEDFEDEAFAHVDACARVVVGAVLADEARCDEHELGQRTGGAVLEVAVQTPDQGLHPVAIHEKRRGIVGVVAPTRHPRGRQFVPDRRTVEDPGAQRPRILLAALGFSGVEVLTVRERRAHHRREMVIENGEPFRQRRVDRQIFGGVVADRVLVVPRARRQETGVALASSGGPSVTGRRALAEPVRIRVVGPFDQCIGGLELPRRVAVPDLVLRLDRELGTPASPPLVEIGTVGTEPTQVVVERPVLHHQHDDCVDGAFACRTIEHRAGRGRGTRGTGPQQCWAHRRRGCSSSHRCSPNELAPIDAVVVARCVHVVLAHCVPPSGGGRSSEVI